jgi:hypothetical protein
MKLRALVVAAASLQRLLRQLGEPVDPPVLAPATVTRFERAAWTRLEPARKIGAYSSQRSVALNGHAGLLGPAGK